MSTPLVVLITAGSAGLGAAAAKVFVTGGYKVIINYANNSERATALVESLRSQSPLPDAQKSIISIKADLGSKSDIVSLVDESVKAMGRLDVVFSNGGWTRIVDFKNLDENMEDEDWDRCYTMNVKSHLWLFHAARKWLEESEGAFITTASTAGVKPSGSSLPYAVTKAAQIHLVKGLAVIGAPKIRVNSVSPSLMMTVKRSLSALHWESTDKYKEWGKNFPQAKQDAALAKTQLKKFATVEDVAEQVYALAKMKTVTGVNSLIDAGMTLI